MIWDFVLSPYGALLYLAFWLFKLTAGIWVLRRVMPLLPVRVQNAAERKLGAVGLRRRA